MSTSVTLLEDGPRKNENYLFYHGNGIISKAWKLTKESFGFTMNRNTSMYFLLWRYS
jgi:hypothetical protein